MKLRLRPSPDKTIPFLILISFLTTFVVSRLFVFLFPFFPIHVLPWQRGVHVHHFAYGIILLSICGLLTLLWGASYKARLRLSILYGIALGLAFDEFAMWLELENLYHDRRNYDAIMIISLIFLNIIYFDNFWKKWGKKTQTLVRHLFMLT